MADDTVRNRDISRRSFLAGLGAAGLGLLLPGAAKGAEPKSGEELATLHDLSKCVGCGACVDACREANAHKFPEPKKPFPAMYPASVKVEDWSTRRHVKERLTPYNWLSIQSARGQYQGQRFEIHIPRRCMHCQNPPCANLCPWGAAARDPNGVVRIDAAICLGGAKCKTVCPWEIPMRQTGVGLYLDLLPRYGGNGVMFKCDRCADRLAVGGKPACIEACPFDVQEIGPRAEIVAKARALAKGMGGFIYGDTENGGTNSLYVSPVPFETLDAAVTTGPGKPHLAPAPDMMADEHRLAYAALLAPVAGIAAGLLRLGSRWRGKGPDDAPPAFPPSGSITPGASRSGVPMSFAGGRTGGRAGSGGDAGGDAFVGLPKPDILAQGFGKGFAEDPVESPVENPSAPKPTPRPRATPSVNSGGVAAAKADGSAAAKVGGSAGAKAGATQKPGAGSAGKGGGK